MSLIFYPHDWFVIRDTTANLQSQIVCLYLSSEYFSQFFFFFFLFLFFLLCWHFHFHIFLNIFLLLCYFWLETLRILQDFLTFHRNTVLEAPNSQYKVLAGRKSIVQLPDLISRPLQPVLVSLSLIFSFFFVFYATRKLLSDSITLRGFNFENFYLPRTPSRIRFHVCIEIGISKVWECTSLLKIHALWQMKIFSNI